MQKLILVYIGVNTKENPYIKRRILTKNISLLINSPTKTVSGTISQSIKLLIQRGFLSKKTSYIGLTKTGKTITKNIIEHIKAEYNGEIDWDIIVSYYNKKTIDRFRYAAGQLEIINQPWDTYTSFCTSIKKFDIKKGDNICVIHTPSHKEEPKQIEETTEPSTTKKTENKKIVKTKKSKTSNTAWKAFANNLPSNIATKDNFKTYNFLIKLYNGVLPEIEIEKEKIFRTHYDMVREHHPNYPPLVDEDWVKYPAAWKKIDKRCNKLMKIQKSEAALTAYLFELSKEKYPNIADEIILLAIDQYHQKQKRQNIT